VAAPKQVDFVDGTTIVAAQFLNRIQEIEAGQATNMALAISGTSVVLNAGVGNSVSSITIDDKFRYIETPLSVAFTGSDASGTYGIFATTSDDDSLSAFALEKVAGTGVPSAANYRKVATVSWDGSSALSSLVQIAGYGKHGHMHTLTTDPLPASSVGSTQIVDNTIVLSDLAVALQNLLVPVGSVIPFAGSSAPAQYLLCAGQEISESTYADLFSVIGTDYNNGTETSGFFRLPDLRGRVVAGKDDMNGSTAGRLTTGGSGVTGTLLGSAGGSETHQLNSSQSGMPAHSVNADGGHSHTVGVDTPDHSHAIPGSGALVQTYNAEGSANINSAPNYGGYGLAGLGGATARHSHSVTGGSHVHTVTALNASSAHQNTQPTIILNHIIRY